MSAISEIHELFDSGRSWLSYTLWLMPKMAPRSHHVTSQTVSPPARPENIDPATSVMDYISQKHPCSARRWDFKKLWRLSLLPMTDAKQQPQVSLDDLKTHFYCANWTVKLHTLDILSGKASNGQSLFRPRTCQDVEQMLCTSQPWLDTDFPEAYFGERDQPRLETRFHIARWLERRIHRYLTGSKVPDQGGILGLFTRWFDWS